MNETTEPDVERAAKLLNLQPGQVPILRSLLRAAYYSGVSDGCQEAGRTIWSALDEKATPATRLP